MSNSLNVAVSTATGSAAPAAGATCSASPFAGPAGSDNPSARSRSPTRAGRNGTGAVMARAGEAPEVVLEATGWYWAVDTLVGLGENVHLAHPLGVKMFSYRRVKNDERDAADQFGLGAHDR